MGNTPQFNFRLDAKLKAALLAKAEAEGTTATDLITGWIEAYLGVEGKKLPLSVNTKQIEDRMTQIENRLDSEIVALKDKVVLLSAQVNELKNQLGERRA